MTPRSCTRIGRFTWGLALALGCTIDQSGGLGLAGRTPRVALEPDGLSFPPAPDGLSSGDTNTPPDAGPDAGPEAAELLPLDAGHDQGGVDQGGVELAPSSPTGKALPRCPPKMGAEACGNAGRPDVAYGRTWDGFVCASCAPSVVGPCWMPPPEENGPYGLCRRPWVCVASCSRDCAELHGPTCAAVP